MEGYKKLTLSNQPALNSIVELSDGIKTITAKWLGDGFQWIPKHFEGGACVVVKPTHWR